MINPKPWITINSHQIHWILQHQTANNIFQITPITTLTHSQSFSTSINQTYWEKKNKPKKLTHNNQVNPRTETFPQTPKLHTDTQLTYHSIAGQTKQNSTKPNPSRKFQSLIQPITQNIILDTKFRTFHFQVQIKPII